MKKYLLPCLFLLLPFTSIAQDGPLLYKDFYNGIKEAKSFVFDDHINILQVNVDNANFDITAVNDQMQIVWRTSLEGFLFTAAKFKGKILAVAATEHSTFKGSNNTYKAYLIDPADGKVLVEKVIFNGPEDFVEFPTVLTGDGAYFKFCVRKSAFERKVHVGLPGIFAGFSMSKYQKQLNETRELDVISLIEKLDSVSSIKLQQGNGTMITWCGNKQGDLFVAWLNGPSIEVFKYPDGSSQPIEQLNADVAFKENENITLSASFQLLASPTNNNILYYGVTYENQDNDAEIGVGKFDFSTGKKFLVTEAFNKDNVKALEKSFVPINKKIKDVDLGRRIDLHLRYMEEADGNLITAISSRYSESSSVNSGGAWQKENSVLINGYDESLNTRFQQILPCNYSVPNVILPVGYHVAKSKLYVVGNEKSGISTLTAIYGCLDISSGKWEKMEELSKKYISNTDYSNGDAILWFGDTYAVPYFSGKGLTKSVYDVTLQQNEY